MPAPSENQARCPGCGAIYDVTGIEPGSTFDCEACATSVAVAAVPGSTSPTRPPAPRRPRAASHDAPSRTGFPVKAFAVVGALVIVAIVAVVILVNRGDPGGPADDEGPSGPAAPKAQGEALPTKYEALRREARASGTADAWFRLATWCEETGYQADQKRAEKLYKYIVFKVDPDHEGARGKLGYTRYDGDVEKFAKLKWLTAADRELLRKAEAADQSHRERLTSDPWYQASEELIREMKDDKYLKKFNLEFTRYPPFLIAKQQANRSTDAFKARILGEMLQAAAEDFRSTLSDLKLEALGNVKFKGKASVLPVIFFEDRYSFDRYHIDQGQEIPKGAAAYFMPANNRIVYFEGEGEGSEKFNLNKMVHELVHQLVWFYTPSRTRCRLHFFQEGVAEFFSGTARKGYTNEEGKRSYRYTFRGKLQQRMKHLKWAQNTHWFTYEELLQIPDKMKLDRMCREKVGEDEHQRANCGALFYAEAWSLFYFLWHHKDGIYRPNLIQYAGMELDGKTGLRHFRQAFEGVDLKEVGRQWRSFVNSSGPFLRDI